MGNEKLRQIVGRSFSLPMRLLAISRVQHFRAAKTV
jgi:hypothetical protein